jgi:hypothetical protein
MASFFENKESQGCLWGQRTIFLIQDFLIAHKYTNGQKAGNPTKTRTRKIQYKNGLDLTYAELLTYISSVPTLYMRLTATAHQI